MCEVVLGSKSYLYYWSRSTDAKGFVFSSYGDAFCLLTLSSFFSASNSFVLLILEIWSE